MFYFIKKNYESKQEYPPSHFYKGHCERKKRKMYAHNMHSTNIKEPKKIWIPNVEKKN